MSISVSVGPFEEFVQEKVSQGEYSSTNEVVQEALRLLKRRDELWQAKIRAKIEAGMASLRAGRVVPADNVKAKIEARIAAAERRSAGGE